MAIDSPAVNQDVAPEFHRFGLGCGPGRRGGRRQSTPSMSGRIRQTAAIPFSLDQPVLGEARPDVAAIYGSQFTHTGYRLAVHDPPGRHLRHRGVCLEQRDGRVRAGENGAHPGPVKRNAVLRRFVARWTAVRDH